MRLSLSRLFLLTVVLTAASCRSGSSAWFGRPSTRPVEASLRIGSWNLRWLGPSEHDRFEGRDPEDLAAYVERSGVAVLVMQEVGQTPRLKLRNSTLDATFKLLDERGGNWQYQLFPSQDPHQDALLGIAWNRNLVALTDSPFALPIPEGLVDLADGTPVMRCLPQVVHFSPAAGTAGFTLVAVELRGNVGEVDAVGHRVAEVRQLVRALRPRQLLSGRVLLIGDFGMPLNVETSSHLLDTQGLLDLNPDNLATGVGGEACGRAYVPEDSAGLVVPGSFQIADFPSLVPDQFRKRLSDEYICSVEIASGR
jgi:hypothetical protein